MPLKVVSAVFFGVGLVLFIVAAAGIGNGRITSIGHGMVAAGLLVWAVS